MLPDCINQWQKLIILDMPTNSLTSLPMGITQIPTLLHLNLQHNQITSIPTVIQMSNINTLIYLVKMKEKE